MSPVATPQAQKDVFNALEESPAGNDMDFVAKLHLVEKHIRNNNLKLTFADRLGLAEDEKGEVSSQVEGSFCTPSTMLVALRVCHTQMLRCCWLERA